MRKVFPIDNKVNVSAERTLVSQCQNQCPEQGEKQALDLSIKKNLLNLVPQILLKEFNLPPHEVKEQTNAKNGNDVEIDKGGQKDEISRRRLQAWRSEDGNDSKNTIQNSIYIIKAPISNENANKNSSTDAVDEEQIVQEEIARKRETRFKRIILNEPIEFTWTEYIVWPLCMVLITFSSTIPLTLIPAHDIIQFPNYWYESLFHGVLLSTWSSACWSFTAGMVLNINFILLRTNLLFVIIIGNVTWLCLQVSSYYFWTEILLYQYPIPFLGFIMAFLMNLFSCCLTSVRISMRKNVYEKIRKRILFYLLFNIIIIILTIVYQRIINMIRTANEQDQPFIALLLPLMREVCVALVTKLVVNCSNGDERGTKIFMKYFIASNHAMSLCYVIGSYTTNLTSWILMGVDFSMNILSCFWVVWIKKKSPYRIHDQINALQNLALYEIVEFQSISFILVIALAYYGPNSLILGNISNSYWTFKEIKDIDRTLSNMGTLFLVDFSSTLVSATILWFCCRINLWKAFVELQKEFRIAFCVILGRQLLAVCMALFERYKSFAN